MGEAAVKVEAVKMFVGKKVYPVETDIGPEIEEAYLLKDAMDENKAQMVELNNKIFEAVKEKFEELEVGSVRLRVGDIECKITIKDTVKVSDPDKLKAVLGDRFDDLVNEKIDYKPEKKLVELSCDADDPLSTPVRECLVIKTGRPGFTYSVK